jgi:RNA-binding protein NOB1
VAASSKGAARHRKRKEVRKQQHQQAFEQEWAEHSELVQQQQQQQQQQQEQQQPQQEQQQPAPEQQPEPEQQHTNGTAGQEEAEDSKAAADATNDELLAEEHCVYTADEDSSASDQQLQQQQLARGPGSPGWQSGVAIITGDFAMQNVLLQMGLRLITKDGRRIARLTRYALRCSACFTVTREPGRLFCPKCGNLSLDRVEVVVDADGAEYFGVTKRHILRGTRYSLPKPKVG